MEERIFSRGHGERTIIELLERAILTFYRYSGLWAYGTRGCGLQLVAGASKPNPVLHGRFELYSIGHCRGFSITISPRSSVSPGLTVNSLTRRRTNGPWFGARSVKR